MKKIVLAALAVVTVAAYGQKNKAAPQKALVEHVVVIGLDGLSSEGLKQAPTPVFDGLIRGGAVKYDARTALPTVSSPNWASMLNGAGPEASGITSNKWQPDSAYIMKPIVANAAGRFPGIYNIISEQMPGAELVAVYHWGGFGRLIQQGLAGVSENYKTPRETAAKFAEYIVEKKPTLAFMQLDHVDAAGHKNLHMSAGYFEAITLADSLAGVVLDGIKRAGIADKTLVLVVSDHGGKGKGHGGESVEEITVPVIYYGPGVKKGYVVQQPVYQYDLAATIAFALGLEAPYVWTGRPTKAAFVGFAEPK